MRKSRAGERQIPAVLSGPRGLRVAMLSIGCVVSPCTALWIATSPVTVSV